MKITKTIELTDEERLTIERYLDITLKIANVAECSFDDVLDYFFSKADSSGGRCSISALHNIEDIG